MIDRPQCLERRRATIPVLRRGGIALVLATAAFLTSAPGHGQEQVWIPKATAGATIKLEATLYRPAGRGPYPILIFNHGATDGGVRVSDTLRPDRLGREFPARGYYVLAPMRQGRGQSEGTYQEPGGCGSEIALGLRNAIADLDAVFAYVRQLPRVDMSRVLLLGQSRGGILSVVYAAERPGSVKAVVNFVGNWGRCGGLFTGNPNDDYFRAAGSRTKIPMLFLYAENDSFNPVSSIRSFAAAFQGAGGNLTFKLYPSTWGDGHWLGRHPHVYSKDLDDFLVKAGFPQ